MDKNKGFTVFTRPNSTYDFDPSLLQKIIQDPASTLNIISDLIAQPGRVLDVGAGNGLLGALLRQKKRQVEIDGLEPNPHAASIAEPYYNYFIKDNFQGYLPKLKEIKYDFIVLADVLEHIDNPLLWLEDLYICVKKDTQIFISIPNIAFGAVRLALLRGEFNYVDSGILERTHLRFFTLKNLDKMIELSGFHINKLYLLKRNMLKTEIKLRFNLTDFFNFYKIYKDETSSVYQFIAVISKKQIRRTTEVRGRGLSHPVFSFVKYYLKRKRHIGAC